MNGLSEIADMADVWGSALSTALSPSSFVSPTPDATKPSGVGSLWSLIPGESIVSGVLGLVNQSQQAEIARQNAAIAAQQQAQAAAQQRANTVLSLLEQQRREANTKNILMGVAGVGILGVAAFIAYKAVSRKRK